MALFNFTIRSDQKLLKLLIKKIDALLESKDDEKLKQEIMDKLNNAISDIRSTIKN